MKNIYKTIKQTARKYALPVIVAGSLALGSCSNDTNYLQVDPKVSKFLHEKYTKNLESLTERADSYAVTARDLFDRGVANQKLDSTTMASTLYNYKKADNLYSIIRERVKKNFISKYENQKLSKEDNKLMKRHNKTLNGIDYGKSEIEIGLRKSGYNVDVYNPESKIEDGIGFISKSLCALGILLVLGFFRKPSCAD